MSRPNNFARYLTALLRHRAIEFGYKMDDQGFVAVDEIISKCTNVNTELIKEIVAFDNKNRFEIVSKQNKLFIRAVQGHSISGINPDLLLVTDPKEIPVVVHGTNFKAYNFIKTMGLSRMERNHIHFAHGTAEDSTVISGMRATAKVMIFIDVDKAMLAGIKFYKSANGVILSEGLYGVIDPKFFAKVEFID